MPLAILSGVKPVFTFLAKNWKYIMIVAFMLLLYFWWERGNEIDAANARTETAIVIAENNFKAMQDSSIELRTTREQLALADTNLAKLVWRLDSMEKNPKTIVIIKPIYIPTDVTVENTLVQDDIDSTKYGLKFNSIDSVRFIKGTSWFNLADNIITPRNTVINEFGFNFGLVVARYDDEENKLNKIIIEPWFINERGEYTKPISKNLLDLKYRGAELLDVPYTENTTDKPPDKRKYSLKTGLTLSVNPIGYGYVPALEQNKLTWVIPTINLGWGITLVRNR